jgi:uncharacterized membrane protein YgcG
MTLLRRLSLFGILFIPIFSALISLQTTAAYAQPLVSLGSCDSTVSDDAQLFGNRVGDILKQAQDFNTSLKADTRVITVSQSTLNGRTLKSYFDYVESRCPTWAAPNIVALVIAKGNEPFLHLGNTFSNKMTVADFQQMTQSIRSEFLNGNYAQVAIDLLQKVQKKLSPDYTGLWITLAVVVVLLVGAALAFMGFRRRQTATVAATARERANQAKQAAVDMIGPLSERINELRPRIDVLMALIPPATANQLQGAFANVQEEANRVQEHLGNLLGNPDSNPNTATLRPEQYGQMQRNYQMIYNEAQGPLQLLHGIETTVQQLERNPQEPVNFRQLMAQGPQRISPPGYSSESTWPGR